jgi:hypothetical protein
MIVESNPQLTDTRVVPIDGIYSSVLKENPKTLTPATILRKLNKHLRKKGI